MGFNGFLLLASLFKSLACFMQECVMYIINDIIYTKSLFISTNDKTSYSSVKHLMLINNNGSGKTLRKQPNVDWCLCFPSDVGFFMF